VIYLCSVNREIHIMGAKVQGNKSFLELSFLGAKVLGNELARERKGHRVNWPGSYWLIRSRE